MCETCTLCPGGCGGGVSRIFGSFPPFSSIRSDPIVTGPWRKYRPSIRRPRGKYSAQYSGGARPDLFGGNTCADTWPTGRGSSNRNKIDGFESFAQILTINRPPRSAAGADPSRPRRGSAPTWARRRARIRRAAPARGGQSDLAKGWNLPLHLRPGRRGRPVRAAGPTGRYTLAGWTGGGPRLFNSTAPGKKIPPRRGAGAARLGRR